MFVIAISLLTVPLQKNALQWTKSSTEAETAEASTPATANTATAGLTDGAEQESCDSMETVAASGENDGVYGWDHHMPLSVII